MCSHVSRALTTPIVKITGHEGDQNGAAYKIAIGRDDLSVKEIGPTINARMGLNTWAAFTGTDANAVIAGDVAMLVGEVQSVLKALRKYRRQDFGSRSAICTGPIRNTIRSDPRNTTINFAFAGT